MGGIAGGSQKDKAVKVKNDDCDLGTGGHNASQSEGAEGPNRLEAEGRLDQPMDTADEVMMDMEDLDIGFDNMRIEKSEN